ncbi:MAG: hypothetical protein AAB524_00080 [Patescibacteria group bacterium]
MEVKVSICENPFSVVIESNGWTTQLEIKEEMLVITRFPTDNPDKTISMVRFSLEGRGKGQE